MGIFPIAGVSFLYDRFDYTENECLDTDTISYSRIVAQIISRLIWEKEI